MSRNLINHHRNDNSPQSSRKGIMAVVTFGESTYCSDQTDSFLTVSRIDSRTLNIKETRCVIQNPLYFRRISWFPRTHYHLYRRGASPNKYRLVSCDHAKGNPLAFSFSFPVYCRHFFLLSCLFSFEKVESMEAKDEVVLRRQVT